MGMHRSGTSAVTRLLNILGLELGPYLMPPSKYNEKGYWEHNDIVALHDKILATLGSSWSDTRPLPDGWVHRDDISILKQELLAVIERDFSNSPLWGFKDPRTCRLLPLWHMIFEDMGSRPSFVFIHRHPEEVAGSLARRDGFKREKSMLLWLGHILEAEQWTRNHRRIFVTFEQVLKDWRDTASRISHALEFSWPVAAESKAAEVEAFLTPSLRHHTAGQTESLDDLPWIGDVHAAVVKAAEDAGFDISGRLDAVRMEFQACLRLFAHMADDTVTHRGKTDGVRKKEAVPNGNTIRIELNTWGQRSAPVSIIIPVFNKIDFTKKCLAALFKNTPEDKYEVIVIDNGSNDGTREYLASLQGRPLRVIANPENMGFAHACNQGAAAASSDYLLFLNNDTEPQEGWLDPLVSLLDNDQTVGAAGSKLLFPDNTIQHAGVLVIENRKSHEPIVAIHAHYKKPADYPDANLTRTYQALTAASILIRRSAFEQAGGFDEGYWNGYEDVDLCFRLGSIGWKIVYQPASVLIHHESQSGPERFSKVHQNIQRLIERWHGKIKPDMIIKEDGSVVLGADRAIQPYNQPTAAYAPRITSKDSRAGLVSIVIPTFNELKYTKECIEGIMNYTPEAHEIIFVDNGSTDGTPKWLRQLAVRQPNIRLIENKKNLGFARACNQGIEAASGEYILLLNNDTVVTKDWLAGMIECLDSRHDAGIVGPMTNNISGIQKVPAPGYESISGLDSFSRSFRERNRHRRIPVRRIVGFCMLFRKGLIEKIGPLDERFGSGNFEDDDLCLRATLAGYRNMIAGDVFIHHYGSRSFIGNRIDYRSALARNKMLFSEKWSGIDTRSKFGRRLISLHAIEKAEQLYRQGRPDEAAEALLEGIKFVREDRAMHYALAEMLIDSRQFKEGLDVLQSMPKDEKDYRHAVLTAYCLAGLERYTEAAELAGHALSLEPDHAPALNLKGVVAYGMNNKEEAAAYFKEAIKAEPGYGEPHTNLGILLWQSGKREEALHFLERGFVLSPAAFDVTTAYHAAVSETGIYAVAERPFREAAALYPRHRRLSFLLIDILLKQEKFEEAMDRIEDAMNDFGIDDGILSAAVSVRSKIGPKGPGAKNSISLSMIVKNEEQRLSGCLASVKCLVDEIIVVDTGSRDRTREIAQAFGAKVYDFPWRDDFAAARNFSISKALGEWILILDADEVIAQSDHQAIRQIVEKGQKNTAYTFITRNYVEPVDVAGWTPNDGAYQEEAGTGWFPGRKVRLFPRNDRIKFENPVHELVEPSLRRLGIKIKECSVPIHHYGKLSRDKNLEKGEIYYRLGKKKLEGDKDNPAALREMAIQAGEIGRYEEAEALWRRLINVSQDNAEAFMNLGFTCIQLGKFNEGLAAAKKALDIAPRMKEAALNYSACELYVGYPKNAISVLEGILAGGLRYPSGTAMLAAAYILDGREEEGMRLLTMLKKEGIDCTEFMKTNIRRLIDSQRPGLAMRLIEAALKIGATDPEFSSLCQKCRTHMSGSNIETANLHAQATP